VGLKVVEITLDRRDAAAKWMVPRGIVPALLAQGDIR
jgi:hypothetical protein